jgi:hypothetical protein
MKRLLAIVLALALSYQVSADSETARPDPKDQIANLAPGTKMTVTTKSGEVVRGHFSSMAGDHFTLATGRAKTLRSISYAEVDKVTVQPKTHTPPGAWIAFGVIVGVVVIAVAVFFIERHNE